MLERIETLEQKVARVVKEDVAEVLRRRFFTPESIKDQAAFKQHVIAALKDWVDQQYVQERVTAIGDDELEEALKNIDPEFYEHVKNYD